MYEDYLQVLNSKNRNERLGGLKSLRNLVEVGQLSYADPKGYVNNHIHTNYSFSPYSPTRAVWEAKKAGLLTAGIVDHDSISGAIEFIQAGKILEIETTIGIECRVSMAHTPFEASRLNNTDQVGIAYVAMHGIPHQSIEAVEDFIKPYRDARHSRNKKMVDKINCLFGHGFMDYESDVLTLSMAHEGGSVTERHLMFALAKKLVEKYGKGQALLDMLKNDWSIKPSDSAMERLQDSDNDLYDYDLLSLLKGNFVKEIYIEADEECPPVKVFTEFANDIGAIPAYAYLGDVTDSITGDKVAMKFEDDFLEDLVPYMQEMGFKAITYMPSRNSYEQLSRLRNLCEQHHMFQISGEDINSPRQSFICEAILKPEYHNLIVSTWALVSHEIEATRKKEAGMFGQEVLEQLPDLNKRVLHYASMVNSDFAHLS